MSRFDGNPFDEDSSSNPYSSGDGGRAPSYKASAPSAATGSYFDSAPEHGSSMGSGNPALQSLRMQPLPPESRAGSAFGAASDIPFSPKSLKRKQKELQAREAELRRREQALANREETLVTARPNWPPCYPLIRHDIGADIPDYLQHTQRVAFFSWMGAITCLTWNFIAVTIAWGMGSVDFIWGMVGFFTALLFLLLGTPLSYFFWYRRLYNAFKNDSSIGLVLFFVSYTSHCLWFTLFAIAPPIFYGGCFMTFCMPSAQSSSSAKWP